MYTERERNQLTTRMRRNFTSFFLFKRIWGGILQVFFLFKREWGGILQVFPFNARMRRNFYNFFSLKMTNINNYAQKSGVLIFRKIKFYIIVFFAPPWYFEIPVSYYWFMEYTTNRDVSVHFDIWSLCDRIGNLGETSSTIGTWEVKLEIMTDRPTDRHEGS